MWIHANFAFLTAKCLVLGHLKGPGGKSKKDSLRFIVVNLFSAPSQTVPCMATGPWDFIVVQVYQSASVDDDGDNSWVKPWKGQAEKSLELCLAPLPLIPGVPHSNIKRRSSEVPLCGGEVMMNGRQQSSSSKTRLFLPHVYMEQGTKIVLDMLNVSVSITYNRAYLCKTWCHSILMW